jgi:hypothetical protein
MVRANISDEELFLQGNKHYANHQYADALSCYQHMSCTSATVQYNMGNCHYYLGRSFDALIWWLRAERHATGRLLQDIQSNKIRAYDVLDSTPDGVSIYHSPISIYLLQCLTLLCWCALLAGVVMLRKQYRGIWIFVCFIGLVSFSTLLWKHYQAHGMCIGCVSKKEVFLYSGPGFWYHQRGTLSYTSLVEIVGSQDAWYKVHVGELQGWIIGDVVEIL